MDVTYGDTKVKVPFYETKYSETPLGLYHRNQRFAAQLVWTRVLVNAIKDVDGIEALFDPIAGTVLRVDPDLLDKHMPDWADRTIRKAALQFWNIDSRVFKLRGLDISVIDPKRYIDFDPKIGESGRGYALIPFKTRMLPPNDFTLNVIMSGVQKRLPTWLSRFNKNKLMFMIRVHGRRVKPRTAILEGIHSNPTEMQKQRALAFFEERGIILSNKEKEAIDNARVLCELTPSSLETIRKSDFVPPWYVSPILTPENYYLYKGVINFEKPGVLERFGKFYYTASAIPTKVKAALAHAACRCLSNELYPVLRCNGIELPVDFHEEPLIISPDEDTEITPIADFTFLVTNPVMIVLRHEEDGYKNVLIRDLEDIALGRGKYENQVGLWHTFEAAEDLKRGIRIGIVSPKGYRAPHLIKATLDFDVNTLDPTNRRKNPRSPIHKIEERLAALRKFFEISGPIWSEIYWLEETPARIEKGGTPTSYRDKMEEALRDGCNIIIVIMPSKYKAPKIIRDIIYYWTYQFGYQHNVGIMHFRPDTWQVHLRFYALTFSLFAHLNRRLGGQTYILETDAVKLFRQYKNPRFVFVDLGRQDKSYVGLVTTADPNFYSSEIVLTHKARGLNDAVQNLSEVLAELVEKNDLLLLYKDNNFQRIEERGYEIAYERMDVPILAVSVLKTGGLQGWKFWKYRSELRVKQPYGLALRMPNGSVEIFPHDVELRTGLWSSIRFEKTREKPIDQLGVGDLDIANLAMLLASTAGYYIFPKTQKYPEFLAKADLATKLVQSNVFSVKAKKRARSSVAARIDARKFD